MTTADRARQEQARSEAKRLAARAARNRVLLLKDQYPALKEKGALTSAMEDAFYLSYLAGFTRAANDRDSWNHESGKRR